MNDIRRILKTQQQPQKSNLNKNCAKDLNRRLTQGDIQMQISIGKISNHVSSAKHKLSNNEIKAYLQERPYPEQRQHQMLRGM